MSFWSSIRRNDDSENWIKQGQSFLREGKVFEAHGCFYHALTCKAIDPQAWIYLGILFSLKNDWRAPRCFGAARASKNHDKTEFLRILRQFDTLILDDKVPIIQQYDEASALLVDDRVPSLGYLIEIVKPEIPDVAPKNLPKCKIQYTRGQIFSNEWNSIEVQVENIGTAFAREVYVTCNQDFELKPVKKMGIYSGKSIPYHLHVFPHKDGEQQLIITAHYKNTADIKASDTEEFSIAVVTRPISPPEPSPVPAGPVTPPHIIYQPPAETTFPSIHEQSLGYSPEMQQENPDMTPGQVTPSKRGKKVQSSDQTQRFEDFLDDQYEESSLLGRGGFSIVYKTKNGRGQEFAVKTPFISDPTAGKAYLNEVKTWEKLKHRNIVNVSDCNVFPIPYIEMELCDCTLKEWMSEHEDLTPSEIASIIVDIAEGLKYAHSMKIIHRDLKPQNILIKNGIPKITDWGLARTLAHSPSNINSSTSFVAPYAAPEQFTPTMQKDARVDIWQLGVIMYEMACNRLPFSSDDPMSLISVIRSESPVSPSQINPLMKDLDPIILKCLEKSPERRYHSAEELLKDLHPMISIIKPDTDASPAPVRDKHSIYIIGEGLKKALKDSDLREAYKHLLSLQPLVPESLKGDLTTLAEAIYRRMDFDPPEEIPERIVAEAEILIHKLNIQPVRENPE